MPFQKRSSTTLKKAQARLNGLISLDPNLNLGNGFTLQHFAEVIEASIAQLQTHNLALAEADRTRIELAQAEASVANLSSRILSIVSAMYGKDSKEYEMAGGKPPSRYRRSKKQSVTLESNASPNQNNQSNTLDPR